MASSFTPPQRSNRNDVLDDVAIDFRQLMKEEKRRAKQERGRQKITSEKGNGEHAVNTATRRRYLQERFA